MSDEAPRRRRRPPAGPRPRRPERRAAPRLGEGRDDHRAHPHLVHDGAGPFDDRHDVSAERPRMPQRMPRVTVKYWSIYFVVCAPTTTPTASGRRTDTQSPIHIRIFEFFICRSSRPFTPDRSTMTTMSREEKILLVAKQGSDGSGRLVRMGF